MLVLQVVRFTRAGRAGSTEDSDDEENAHLRSERLLFDEDLEDDTDEESE